MWTALKIAQLVITGSWIKDKVDKWRKKTDFKITMTCTKTYKKGDKEKEKEKAKDNSCLFVITADTMEIK